MASRRSRIKLAPKLGVARATSRPGGAVSAAVNIKQEKRESSINTKEVKEGEKGSTKLNPVVVEEAPLAALPKSASPLVNNVTKRGDLKPKILNSGDIIPLELLKMANSITAVTPKEEGLTKSQNDKEDVKTEDGDKKDGVKASPGGRVRNWFPKARPNLAEARVRHSSCSGDEELRSPPPIIKRAAPPVVSPSTSSHSATESKTADKKEEKETENIIHTDKNTEGEDDAPKPVVNNSIGIDLGTATRKPKKEKDPDSKKSIRKVIVIEEPVDRAKTTMGDLIYLRPTKNPMSASKEKKTKRLKSEDGKDDKSEHVRSESEDDIMSVSADIRGDTLQVKKDEPPDDPQIVPQLTIGVNGEIIINEASLLLENRDPEADARAASMELVNEADLPMFKYGARKRGAYWTDLETKKFYLALSSVGTDFSLMEKLFPARTRNELKRKFKREEKQNRNLVDKAIRERQIFDQEFFDNLALLDVSAPNPKRRRKGKATVDGEGNIPENPENASKKKEEIAKKEDEKDKLKRKPGRPKKTKVTVDMTTEVPDFAEEKPQKQPCKSKKKPGITYNQSDQEEEGEDEVLKSGEMAPKKKKRRKKIHIEIHIGEEGKTPDEVTSATVSGPEKAAPVTKKKRGRPSKKNAKVTNEEDTDKEESGPPTKNNGKRKRKTTVQSSSSEENNESFNPDELDKEAEAEPSSAPTSNTNTDILGPASITNSENLAPNSITNTEILAPTSITNTEGLAPTSITNTEKLAPTSITNTEILAPTSTTNTEGLAPTSITNTEILAPTSTTNTEGLAPTSITNTEILAPTSITNTEILRALTSQVQLTDEPFSTPTVSLTSPTGTIETHGKTTTIQQGPYLFVASASDSVEGEDGDPTIHVYLISPDGEMPMDEQSALEGEVLEVEGEAEELDGENWILEACTGEIETKDEQRKITDFERINETKTEREESVNKKDHQKEDDDKSSPEADISEPLETSTISSHVPKRRTRTSSVSGDKSLDNNTNVNLRTRTSSISGGKTSDIETLKNSEDGLLTSTKRTRARSVSTDKGKVIIVADKSAEKAEVEPTNSKKRTRTRSGSGGIAKGPDNTANVNLIGKKRARTRNISGRNDSTKVNLAENTDVNAVDVQKVGEPLEVAESPTKTLMRKKSGSISRNNVISANVSLTENMNVIGGFGESEPIKTSAVSSKKRTRTRSESWTKSKDIEQISNVNEIDIIPHNIQIVQSVKEAESLGVPIIESPVSKKTTHTRSVSADKSKDTGNVANIKLGEKEGPESASQKPKDKIQKSQKSKSMDTKHVLDSFKQTLKNTPRATTDKPNELFPEYTTVKEKSELSVDHFTKTSGPDSKEKEIGLESNITNRAVELTKTSDNTEKPSAGLAAAKGGRRRRINAMPNVGSKRKPRGGAGATPTPSLGPSRASPRKKPPTEAKNLPLDAEAASEILLNMSAGELDQN